MPDECTCRVCGSELEPAGIGMGSPPGDRAVCPCCGSCWDSAGAGPEVDTLACPGCPRRGTCESRPSWLTEEMTHRQVLTGGTVVVIRPLLHGDRFELATAYTGLSVHSRRMRFFAAAEELDSDDVEYLTSLDYHDHFAFAAFVVDRPWPRGIGVGRYVRDPTDPTVAEVAVTVTDAYQHRGLGTLLTRLLADVAVTNGIRTFVNYVLWENAAAIDLLTEQGARATPSEPGVARIELDLPNTSDELADSNLHHILRAFADAVRDVFTRRDVTA